MRFAAALAVLLVAACGLKQPQEQREKRTVQSWAASLALAGDAWTRGELPKHFVRNAAEAAVEELTKSAKGHDAARVIALGHQLEDAVERDDRAAAARIAIDLEEVSR
ncbi:MAG TPA: hypothetical protein VG323_10480 [Thermoanaerobaculia bacterium]|nr:hypothetical protein [Thermoanaerobaculia bacterium]